LSPSCRGARLCLHPRHAPHCPNPRSAISPNGVHVTMCPRPCPDHSAFEWRNIKWPPGAVARGDHLLMFTSAPSRRFGPLTPRSARLAYLGDLGRDSLELMPVVRISGARGVGYDGVRTLFGNASFEVASDGERSSMRSRAWPRQLFSTSFTITSVPEGSYNRRFRSYFTNVIVRRGRRGITSTTRTAPRSAILCDNALKCGCSGLARRPACAWTRGPTVSDASTIHFSLAARRRG